MLRKHRQINHLIAQWTFFKNVRKVVTPIRNAISTLDLSLDKHFDQTDSIPSELISLIGLITKKNSSSRNASQSTLITAGLIVYDYKKGPISVKAQSRRCQ